MRSDPAEVWVFDVDGCLVDSLTGASLRPDAEDLLVHLRRRGCAVHLWSAGGADYARARATRHGIDQHFTAFHDKASRDDDGRYIPEFLDRLDRAVFVDDRPEDMPVGADVVAVAPYIADNPHDRGLRPALARADLVVTG